MRMRNSTTKMR